MRQELILSAAVALLVVSVSVGAAEPTPTFKEVKQIISVRCQSCHTEEMSVHGIYDAAGGIKYDTADEIHVYADGIMRAVALDNSAPPDHRKVGLTDDERQTLRVWYAAGAKTTP